MATLTTNYGLSKPAVNNPSDEDIWGGELNGNSDELDGLLLSAFNFIPSVKTSSFSVTAPTTGSASTGGSHVLYRCDATTGTLTPALPTAVNAGFGFTVAFKKTDSSINAVPLTASGGDKIDGESTFVLNSQYDWVIVVSDGISEWDILSNKATTAGLAPINSPNFTGTPTAPTPSLGDATTAIATTAFVNQGSSLASAGYQKFPSGLVWQWGTIGSIAPGGTTKVITFPIAFPNACDNAQATWTTGSPNNGGFPPQVSALTTTTMVVQNLDPDTTFDGYWTVIGR